MAKRKHSIDVLIKARDEASKKFNKIGGSATGMASALKKAAAAAAVYFSGRAVKRFMEDAVKLAAVQIRSNALLAQSMKNTGNYSREAFKDLQDFASQVQKVTVYGDEMTESLMSMGLNLGILPSQIKEAVKGAYGLQAMFGGRMKPEMALRYIAQAFKGEYASLSTYIVALRTANTEAEKHAILMKAMADGYKLVQVNARTALGPVEQMKNTLGDVVKEAIGAAFLPWVQKSADAIKRWAENNQERIRVFAEKAAAYMTYFKDVVMSIVDAIKTDWKGSFTWMWDSFLELMKAAMESAIDLALAGGKGIWAALKKGLTAPLGARIQKVRENAILKGEFKTRDDMFVQKWNSKTARYERQSEYTEYGKTVERRAREGLAAEAAEESKGIIKSAISSISETWSAAIKKITDTMPEQMRADLQTAAAKRNRALIAALTPSKPPGGERYIGPLARAGGAGGAVAAFTLADLLRQKLAPQESRFLQYGSRRDPAVETAQGVKKMVQLLQKIDKNTEDLEPDRLGQDFEGSNF